MQKLSPARLAAAACLAASIFSPALANDVEPQGGMLRYPDASRSHIAFVYAGDIWLVGREGGQAMLLASPAGQELFPRFSPDGNTLAFTGNYEGNRDIYTIPVTGGVASRVTYHPSAETLCDWTPDGKLVYFMSGLGGLRRQTQLFTTDGDGGMPAQLPVPYGANGSISPDGQFLAYTPHSTDTRTWKRYRGGMATNIWLFNLADKSAKQITDWEGTDTLPMWNKDKVYYLSDAGPEHRLNIWVYSTASGNRKQVTKFTDFDVKWPSMGPGPSGKGEIVFQNGASLYLLDLDADDNTPKAVKVTIPGDRPAVRSRLVNASEFISGWSVSPSGKRVAAEARGDLWSLPAEKGSPRDMSRTHGHAERDPSWSPDGRWIAYFSDQTGEYELYLTQSDGKGPTVQLTKEGDAPQVFRYSPTWSPDSKHIAFTDKAGALFIHTLGEADKDGVPTAGKTRHIDTDPWSGPLNVRWSHDSAWVTYHKDDENSRQGAIWVCQVTGADGDEAKPRRVTSGMFNDVNPTFDRKGDYIFFVSNRTFSPTYSDLDTTFIYGATQNLLAIPLRSDIESPWNPKSDEEDWRDAAKKAAKKDKKDEAKDGEESDKDSDKKKEDAKAADALSGSWEGTGTGPDPLPPGGMPFSLSLKLGKDGAVTGTLTCAIFTGPVESGQFDGTTLSFSLTVGEASVSITLKLEGDQLKGSAEADGATFQLTARKSGAGVGADDAAKADKKKADEKKPIKIDFEDIEARAMMLPIAPGRFGRPAVNDKGHLIYARSPALGSGEAGIKVFDLSDEKKEEKAVTNGGGFELTPDGKKLLAVRGRSAVICDAAAGGGNSKTVVTSGMNQNVNPREEWKQIFTDAWRIQRDFFYDPNMHRVDWNAMRERYGKMVEDCASRDDLSFVISEMISELNVGHAYYSGGDVDSGPSVSVGMLGCDFELVPATDDHPAAYRISRIYRGAPWDADAKGPLSQPGINVKEGDYLLAVNGVPVDTSRDPWAAFQGLANRVVTVTVNDVPSFDEPKKAEAPEGSTDEEKSKETTASTEEKTDDSKSDDKAESKKAKPTTGLREVVVQALGSEDDLRFRAWIEAKRKYVEEATNGKVGYVYVPDTGQNGQNNLFRQFYGQIGKEALIIDERWNGGGQIPTRFIELLNRPVVNYWARRDGKDWTWPPDSHQGPKCMLINGLAGSGGDAFPSYFKQLKLGKTIGMRTWGGLVGISGNPGLIDGGNTTAPTFGYYKTSGAWGIEGHGVDPDIEVIDDPSKMQTSLGNPYGGDPQLDAAIAHMLEEIEKNGYHAPKRPEWPDRAGMGLPEEQR